MFYNITPREIADIYPLITDIKGIEAEIGIMGINRVADKLLEVGGIPQILQYMLTDFSKKPDYTEHNAWTIALGKIIIQDQINYKLPKVLYELGLPNEFKNRITIYVERNELVYRIVDNSFKTISLSANLKKLNKDGGTTIFAQYDKVNHIMRFVLEREVVDEIQTSRLDLPKTFFSHSKQILGCTLELEDPGSFLIGSLFHYSIFLSLEQINGFLNMMVQNVMAQNKFYKQHRRKSL